MSPFFSSPASLRLGFFAHQGGGRRLAGCHLDCRLTASHEAGDHIIFVGEVLALGIADEAQPLLFHNGKYHLLPA